jgi:two-component system sensor histidine kinase KdpD
MKLTSLARKSAWLEYGLAIITFVAASLLNVFLKRWIGYQAIALVYLLTVVLLALFVGRGPILLGTALTALAWSYMFAPPPYSFHIGSFYDKMMFAMYFIVALTVAQLTARLRVEQQAEHRREEHSRALYLFTRELADGRDREDILERVITHIGKTFGAKVALLFPGMGDNASSQRFPDSTWCLNDSDQAVAMHAIARNEPVGQGTRISPEANGLFLPLSAGAGPVGVLALQPETELSLEQRELLENFARQTALVLDRQRLRDAEVKTRLLAESERFGRTLLNSVSHELRTPLAAIATAAETLRDSGPLSPLQAQLASEIDSAIARLNRVVQSLLSAARIQSGQIRPNLDWCDVADVVRAALREMKSVLAGRNIERQLQPGLPLIQGDFVLLQQALANLLVNAAAYTPPGTTIEVSAEVIAGEAVIRVADRGPGLPPDEVDRIFDLFHRVPNSRPGGTGLGLAIVKGFVEAQGGRVAASNRQGGGAVFSMFLPIRESPEFAEDSL